MPAKRATGRFGPNGLAHIIRTEVGFKGQTEGWLQWGKCVAVHGSLYTNTTLYANVSAGATSFQSALPTSQTSGAAVVALWTVDVFLNGTQIMPTPSMGTFVTIGIRFEEGWNPVVGDVVPVIRGPGGLVTDRFVLREMAGIRGPGGSAFVALASGAPPSAVPWGIGSIYLDQFDNKVYFCTVGSIQNSSGVVTTPATWKSCTIS